jgi:hypothetical protein
MGTEVRMTHLISNSVALRRFQAGLLAALAGLALLLALIGIYGVVFSKSIDELSGDPTPQNVSQTVPLNRRLNRGVSDFDLSHRLIVSHVWALPGLSAQNRLLRVVLGDWEFSGITTLRSGYPFSVSSGTDRAFAGLGSNFADLVGNPYLDNRAAPPGVNRALFQHGSVCSERGRNVRNFSAQPDAGARRRWFRSRTDESVPDH